MFRRRPQLVLTLLALALSAPLHAAGISDRDLATLGDDDFNKRHEATRRLLADETVTPQQIADAFKAATSAEQRNRLLTIAEHHVIRRLRKQLYRDAGPNGALGLTHGALTSDEAPQLEGRAAVRVRKTLPGFPAHAVLEAGDLILAIDGQPIPPGQTRDQISQHFGNTIQGIPAGRSVEFTVFRDGKSRTVAVTLASRNALDDMYLPQGLTEKYLPRWLEFKESLKRGEQGDE